METEKMLECIKLALEDKIEVKLQRGKSDLVRTYLVNEIVFSDEEKTAKCTRLEDSKQGSISISSEDLEQIYKNLPNKYKIKEKEEKMDEENTGTVGTQETQDNQETGSEKETAVPAEKSEKKMSATKLILNFIKDNPGCTYEQIEKAYLDNGKIVKSMKLKDYISSLKYDGKKSGKYSIEYDKESKTYKYAETSNQNSN